MSVFLIRPSLIFVFSVSVLPQEAPAWRQVHGPPVPQLPDIQGFFQEVCAELQKIYKQKVHKPKVHSRSAAISDQVQRVVCWMLLVRWSLYTRLTC